MVALFLAVIQFYPPLRLLRSALSVVILHYNSRHLDMMFPHSDMAETHLVCDTIGWRLHISHA